VADEFDIQALRRQLRTASGGDRRKPSGRSGPEAAALPGAPSLFEWAGLDSRPTDPVETAEAPEWPPVVVPVTAAHRARPFGRRLDLVPGVFELGGASGDPDPVTVATYDLFERLQYRPEVVEAETAVVQLCDTLERLSPVTRSTAGAAERLLQSLASTLLLERDQLEARLADNEPPLQLMKVANDRR
jgi:hypothetical protein